jgi:SAM-dependent methyltransferase
MPDRELVSNHYTHGSLVDAITAGVHKLGKTIATVSVEDLGPVDEFHVGGRVATEAFLDQLDIRADHHVLDVGCGLGGASRFAAARYNCRVTGIDLTAEYVETGNALCDWVGLTERVQLSVGDATALAQAEASFDRAYLMHVGMNIADKEAVAFELYRIVRPGGRIGIYDIMRMEDGELDYPVPWAAVPDASALASPAEYKAALTAAGFSIVAERNRRDFAVEFFARMQERARSQEGPPPLGIHILMGNSAPLKVKNMIGNITRNLLAPVELVATKPARL